MNNVRTLRMRKGIQQKELAIEIGVSQATVSDWEHGRKNPSGERLRKLSAFFGVNSLVVLGEAPDPGAVTEAEDTDVINKSETEKIIERLMKQLDSQPRTPEARLLAKGVDRMQPERRKAFTAMMIDMCPDIFEKGIEIDDT